jgi:hypothetical protein
MNSTVVIFVPRSRQGTSSTRGNILLSRYLCEYNVLVRGTIRRNVALSLAVCAYFKKRKLRYFNFCLTSTEMITDGILFTFDWVGGSGHQRSNTQVQCLYKCSSKFQVFVTLYIQHRFLA